MVNKYPEFDRDRYREIFDSGFGEGRYNSVIRGARETGELKVAAKEAEKSYKARQKEREKAAKAIAADPLAGFTAPKQSQNRQAGNSLLDSIVSGAKKVGSGIARVGSELARFDDIATNTLTAGLKAESEKRIEARGEAAGKDLGLTKYLDARADGDVVGKGLDIAANIAGYVPSGIGATALLRGAGATGQGVRALAQARKAGQSTKGLRGAAAKDAAKEGVIIGGALAAPEAAVRLGLNEESDTSLLDELKFVGVSAALGGALDPLLAVGAPLARDAAQRSLQGTVDNAVVNSTAEEAARRLAQGNNSPSDVGQQILEQLRTSRNPSASTADQALSRLNASTTPDFSLPQTNRGVPTSAERGFTSSDSLQNITGSPRTDVPLRRVSGANTQSLDELLGSNSRSSTGSGARLGEQNTPPTRNPIPPSDADLDQSFIDRTIYEAPQDSRTTRTKLQESFTNDLAPIREIDKGIQGLDADKVLEYLEPKTLIPSRVRQPAANSSLERSLTNAQGSASRAANHVVERFSPFLKDINQSKSTNTNELGDYAFAKNGLKRFADDAQAQANRDGFIEDLETLRANGQGNSEEAKILEGLIDDYTSYVNVRGATPEVLQGQVARFEQNPELVKYYDEFAKLQRQNLEDLKTGGLITDKLYNKLLENDTYISTVRNFQDGSSSGGSGTRRPRNPLERLRGGSEEKIKDPVLGALRNSYETRFNIEKNNALQVVSKFAKIDKQGEFFRGVQSPNQNTITIFQNGNPKYFEVPPALKNYVDNIDSSKDPDALSNSVQKLAQLQRKLTTQYNLSFQLKSLVREPVQAITTSRTAKTGLGATRNVAIGYLDAIAGPQLQELTKNLPRALQFNSYKPQWDKLGGTGFQYIKTSDEDLQKTAQRLLDSGTARGNIRNLNPFNVLSKVGEKIEEGPRLGEFRSAKAQGYSDEDAFFEATDITNYKRSGTATRTANKYVPFLNATVQGNSRVARAFAEAPERTIVRGMSLLSSTALGVYGMRYLDGVSDQQRQELQNLQQFEKDSFIHIPVPIEGNDTIIAIPKAFAVGQMFMNPIERALDQFTNNTLTDKSAGTQVREGVVSTLKAFAPPTDIAGYGTALELKANKSFFTGQDIESQFDIDAGVPKAEREAYNQSYLTKVISDVVNGMSFSMDEGGVVSPAQIDYLVKDILGTTGTNALQTTDLLRTDNAPVRTGEDALARPLAQFTTDPTRASGVYEQLKKLSQQEKANNVDLTTLTKGEKEEERNKRVYQNIEKQFKDINKSIQQVRNDTTLSSQDKKDRIIYLREQQDQLGSATIDYYNSLK